jgi:hypothetical protein
MAYDAIKFILLSLKSGSKYELWEWFMGLFNTTTIFFLLRKEKIKYFWSEKNDFYNILFLKKFIYLNNKLIS